MTSWWSASSPSTATPGKGRRPSFIHAAHSGSGHPPLRAVSGLLREEAPGRVESGEFGAMMDVELVNAGPVTLVLER